MNDFSVNIPGENFWPTYNCLRGRDRDIFALRSVQAVSLYWIMQSHARSNRIEQWVRSGKVVLEQEGFPMYRVAFVSDDLK